MGDACNYCNLLRCMLTRSPLVTAPSVHEAVMQEGTLAMRGGGRTLTRILS
jgi:hypothetical protein